MNANNKSIRSRVGLALGVGTLAIAAAFAGGSAAGANPGGSPGTIKSGAGPGWPRTLKASDFGGPIDNPWFPLKPGSQYRYRGVKDGKQVVENVRVTHKTKRILGVPTTVIHDELLSGGKPVEVTNDWYAQDRHGNVWYFGEATKTLDGHGHVISRSGSFEAGRNGARAGLFFPAHPRVGQAARQEYYKGKAEDHFKILDLSTRVSVPHGSSSHALRTKEWTPLEPGVIDNKYYVRGVGTVNEVAVKGGNEHLRLVSFQQG